MLMAVTHLKIAGIFSSCKVATASASHRLVFVVQAIRLGL